MELASGVDPDPKGSEPFLLDPDLNDWFGFEAERNGMLDFMKSNVNSHDLRI
jgi:hypothetical protein